MGHPGVASVAAAGLTEAQIVLEQRIELGGRDLAGQVHRSGDVTAGRFLVARQGVEQEAVVERGGIGGEQRHHLITAAEGFLEPIQLHLLQTVLPGDLPLGKGLLATGREQGEKQEQAGRDPPEETSRAGR